MTADGVFGGDTHEFASAREGATLFGSTMEMVALTAGCFALGAFLGRAASPGWAFVFFIVSLGLLIAVRFAVRTSTSLTVGLLLGFGLTVGLRMSTQSRHVHCSHQRSRSIEICNVADVERVGKFLGEDAAGCSGPRRVHHDRRATRGEPACDRFPDATGRACHGDHTVGQVQPRRHDAT